MTPPSFLPKPITAWLTKFIFQGLGRALSASYLARPSCTVIAAVRDPKHATALELQSLPKGPSSALVIVKIDSAVEGDAAAAVDSFCSAPYSITALDVVIANAGIGKVFPRVAEARTADVKEHHDINVLGPLTLFQATLPLLNHAKAPKFVTMSSLAGTIGGMEDVPVPNAVYAPSKTALNWLTRKIHFEHENLIVFPLHPG